MYWQNSFLYPRENSDASVDLDIRAILNHSNSYAAELSKQSTIRFM